MSDQQLLRLAKQGAGRNHVRWKPGTKKFNESGHTDPMYLCSHPDCVLVRDSPAVERETADLLTDLPRYEPKDLAKEVRGGAKASPLVGIWRESNSGVMPVLKWSDIEALRAAPRETRRPPIEFDNHHNALACPYCNPNNLTLAEQPASESVKAIQEHQRGAGGEARTEPAWQPIETAPKDGTPIWLVEDGAQLGMLIAHQTVGFWVEHKRYTAGGFWQEASRDFVVRPTHWMPLPSVPSREGASK